MAQQTVTQPKKTPKASVQKSIETTNTHTCAESDHCMLPIVKCENWSRTTCYRFHRLHSESNPRVGDCGEAHALCVQPTAPFPHALKSKKTHSLTLLLQNHLDHVNILLQGLWARPPVLSLVPLQANHNPPKKHQSKASEQQHGVQKSLITSTICSLDLWHPQNPLITSTICSWIYGTGTAITIRCTRRTCS